jgi:hypothetical protein
MTPAIISISIFNPGANQNHGSRINKMNQVDYYSAKVLFWYEYLLCQILS